jgi:hypothetical protein
MLEHKDRAEEQKWGTSQAEWIIKSDHINEIYGMMENNRKGDSA